MKDSKIRIDAPHTATTAAGKQDQPRSPADVSHAILTRRGSVAAVVEHASADPESSDDAADNSLSKAERRRQRKLRRREKSQS